MEVFVPAHKEQNQNGFTILELLIVMMMIGILSTIFFVVFKSTLVSYLDLQRQASSFGQLSNQAERIANVLRGTTSISSASDNDLTVYSYFYPSDAYVSQVRYYVVSGATTKLYADLTPMSANPPVGTLQNDKKKSFVVIDNFYQPSGGKLYSYMNANGASLTTPVTDLSVVKSIQINLSTQLENARSQDINVQVVLRNKKNNL
ncbi:prepilin-type N-terminal cleavage/methylation domain-containing protein [Candidatus Saccharibacteria bacterium]|nr:MAG: prepilin-type N-terminal cleavage/methylation domain-containing protein [Candidatus Saccharibacteria bacterium]